MERGVTGRPRRRTYAWAPLAVVLVVGHGAAHGTEIARQCLVSYQVKEETSVEIDGTSMSCVHLEGIRAGILETLIAIEGDAQRTAIESRQVEALRTQAKAARTKHTLSHLKLGWNMVGNVVAMLALSTCNPTPTSLLCLGAVAGVIERKVQVVLAVQDFSETSAAARILKQELNRAEQALRENRGRMRQAKGRVTNEFNALCEIVRTQCQ